MSQEIDGVNSPSVQQSGSVLHASDELAFRMLDPAADGSEFIIWRTCPQKSWTCWNQTWAGPER